jgi:hypothetical protein
MKKIAIGLLLGMGVVMGVQAEDVGVNIDGKNIVVTSAEKSRGSNEERLHQKDFSSGIFLQASTLSGEVLKNASEIIKARFTEHGFKVVESPEIAGIAIGFITYGALDLKNADQQAEHSILPNSHQVAVNSGSVIGSVISLGPIGAIGYAAGWVMSSGEETTISGVSCLKPIYGLARGKKYIYSNEKNGEHTNNVKISYKFDNASKANDDTVLKMLVDQWINRYMVIDTSETLAAPASSVAATN